MVDIEISNLILNLQNLICEIAKGVVSVTCYGYGCNSDRSKLTEHIEDKRQLEQELIDQRLGGNVCFDSTELSRLVGEINKKVLTCTQNCTDLKIDDSNYQHWLFKNPYCRVYESWEQCLNLIKPEYQANFSSIDSQSYFKLGLSSTEITPQVIVNLQSIDLNNTFDLQGSAVNIGSEFKFNVELLEKSGTIELDLRMCELNHELLIFSEKLITNFNLDVSSILLEKVLELEVFVKSFDFSTDLEIYIQNKTLSSNLAIYIKKLACVLDIPILSKQLELGNVDLDTIKAIYKAGCILNLNPVSLENRKGVLELSSKIKNNDAKI